VKRKEAMEHKKFRGLLRQGARGGSPVAFILKYVALSRWRFIVLFTCVVLAGTCAVTVQYQMKTLVDAMAATTSRQVSAVIGAFTVFIVVVGIETMFWRAAGWLGARAIVGSGVQIRLDLFEQLSAKPLAFFSGAFSGALGSRITAVSGAFGSIMNTLIWNVLPPCIDFVGALLLFSLMDLGMAAAVLTLVVVTAGGLFVFGVKGKGFHQNYAKEAGRASGELTDTIANIAAIKMFGMRFRERQRLSEILRDEANAQLRSWTYLEKSRMLHDCLLWFAAAAIFAWAIFGWANGHFSPGDVVLVSALTFRILHGSRDLALALIGTSNHFAILREALELFHTEPSEAPGIAGLDTGEPPAIEVVGLSFAHREDAPVFDDLNLHIPAGQRVGIVGESGAGKSTLLALLHGLHEPQTGDIRFGATSRRSLSEENFRDLIAFVPQDVTLFHRSILDNLCYGRPDASEEDILAAAEIAQCGFIQDMPDGYDTIVGEGGTILSGGQRQRIAIARALLKKAPVLLLDEATSALDVETERRLRHALAEACVDKTIIAATHRLITLESFDRVVVLRNGRIVQDAPPSVVLARFSAPRVRQSPQSRPVALAQPHG
jgi:ATP-binding cassette subfamily B protein